MPKITRRQFVRGSAATTFAMGLSSLKPLKGSPNDEIRVGVIGLRGRGGAHINGLHGLDGVRVVGLCDVDEKVLAGAAKKFAERQETVQTFTDLRKMLDRDDIDAVAIASPNHWHSLNSIWACQAGKDVYVEKPVSHNVFEGRKMVEAARKYGRIVQTGTQGRSSKAIQDAIAWAREGHLGRITMAHGVCYKPRKSIGKVDGPQTVPSHIDYDLWLGPAPKVPLMRRSLHYDWHWVFDTGNGDLGNQGVHQVDICRWALGEDALPKSVLSVGGRFGYDDDGNTPNTLISYFDYEAAPLVFEVRGLPRDSAAQKDNWGGGGMDRHKGMSIGVAIHCEKGHLAMSSNYNKAEAFDEKGERVKSWSGTSSHFANFVDAVRSRRVEDLRSDIQEGHLSAALCHVANASYLAGKKMDPDAIRAGLSEEGPGRDGFDGLCAHLDRNGVDPSKVHPTAGPRLAVDPATEAITNNAEANALLTRVYREPFVVRDKV